MRILAIFSLAIVLCTACDVNQPKEAISLKEAKVMHEADQPINGFDSTKAQAYGADDYGMKRYVIAFLKSGPNRPTDSVKAAELQKAHMENISRMAEAGQLVLAGTFLGNDSLRGIYIFDTPSIEEAEKLTASDPAIEYGSLKMELRPWYGTAALMEVREIHQRITKVDI